MQRNLFGIGQFGGQIIDGDIVRAAAARIATRSRSGRISLSIEHRALHVAHASQRWQSNGGPAVIRATGVDDLLDFVNPSSVVGQLRLLACRQSARRQRHPGDGHHRLHRSSPATNYVRVETTVQNTGGALLKIFFGEYINGSGQIEMFQPGYGFG